MIKNNEIWYEFKEFMNEYNRSIKIMLTNEANLDVMCQAMESFEKDYLKRKADLKQTLEDIKTKGEK